MSDNPDMLIQLTNILTMLGRALGDLVVWLGEFVYLYWILIVWIAWCLWGINWNKAWHVLARGAWVPVVLLTIATAWVWSQVAPSTCSCLGILTVPNFWWQLGDVFLLLGITLFCGWLQGVFGWTPAEIDLEPPAAAAHGHGHH